MTVKKFLYSVLLLFLGVVLTVVGTFAYESMFSNKPTIEVRIKGLPFEAPADLLRARVELLRSALAAHYDQKLGDLSAAYLKDHENLPKHNESELAQRPLKESADGISEELGDLEGTYIINITNVGNLPTENMFVIVPRYHTAYISTENEYRTISPNWNEYGSVESANNPKRIELSNLKQKSSVLVVLWTSTFSDWNAWTWSDDIYVGCDDCRINVSLHGLVGGFFGWLDRNTSAVLIALSFSPLVWILGVLAVALIKGDGPKTKDEQ